MDIIYSAIAVALIVILLMVLSVLINRRFPKIFRVLLLAASLWCIAAVTLLRHQGAGFSTLLLKPFRSYSFIWSVGWDYSAKFKFREVVGNVALFVPLGIVLTDWKPDWKPIWWFLTGLLVSGAIEATQYIFHIGTVETDDLIHNTFGVVCGFLLHRAMTALRKKDILFTILYLLPILAFGEVVLVMYLHGTR